MNRFLDELSKALRGNIPDGYVKSNLDYYKQYIQEEKNKGRKEADIISELGDPRLIAKNIINTSPVKNENNRNGYYEEYDNDSWKESQEEDYIRRGQKRYDRTMKTISFFNKASSNKIGRILLGVGSFVVAAIMIWLFFGILGFLITYILPVILIVVLIKAIVGLFRGK